jgi:hypothetical protein
MQGAPINYSAVLKQANIDGIVMCPEFLNETFIGDVVQCGMSVFLKTENEAGLRTLLNNNVITGLFSKGVAD